MRNTWSDTRMLYLKLVSERVLINFSISALMVLETQNDNSNSKGISPQFVYVTFTQHHKIAGSQLLEIIP